MEINILRKKVTGSQEGNPTIMEKQKQTELEELKRRVEHDERADKCGQQL